MSTTPLYFFFEGELILEAPVDVAWPHVVNYPSWQNYPIARHVSGVPGEEGEVMLLKKEEAGVSTSSYFARTIKLEPGRRIVWKVYPETRTPDNDFQGFVDFRVEGRGETTCFRYSTIHEVSLHGRDEADLEEDRRRRIANSAAVFASIFPKLQELVRSSHAGKPPR